MPRNTYNHAIQALRLLDRKLTRAVCRYELILPGNRVLVGASGGKDSLMPLALLAMRRAWRPETYEVAPCYVDNDFCRVGCDYAETLRALCRTWE